MATGSLYTENLRFARQTKMSSPQVMVHPYLTTALGTGSGTRRSQAIQAT